MSEDERWARVRELHGVIEKAERELKGLEPSKSFLMKIQEDLDAFDAELAAGDDYVSKGHNLGNVVAAALNMMNERLQGAVSTHGSGSVTVSTDVGDLLYEEGEWYFLENQ